HTHGFAKANREYVFEKTGHDIVPVKVPLNSMDDMHAWAKANIGTLFAGREGRTLGIESNIVGALKDGVSRIEIGSDVWMINTELGSPRELVEQIIQVHERMAPHIEWIPQLGLSRQSALAAQQEWMAPWLDLGFHKVLDMSGDELAQPIELFQPLYRA